MKISVKRKIDSILEEVNRVSSAKDIIGMFSLANTANVTDPAMSFAANRETTDVICGNILVSSPEDAVEVAKYVDGKVKVILLDVERKKFKEKHYEEMVRNAMRKSEIITFKPNDLTVEALDSFISMITNDITNRKIAIIGCGNVGSKIALKLLERDSNIVITRRKGDEATLKKIAEGLECMKCKGTTSQVVYTTDNLSASRSADVLIGSSAGTPCIDEKMVDVMNNEGIIIDVGNKTISAEGIELANEKGIKIYTLFMQPGFEGQIKCLLETRRLIKKLGRRRMGRYSLVSVGMLGKKGDILVDDISNPTRIIGVTDGQGGLMKTSRNLPSIGKMKEVKK
jgi:hypothetical protein